MGKIYTTFEGYFSELCIKRSLSNGAGRIRISGMTLLAGSRFGGICHLYVVGEFWAQSTN